MCLGICSGSVYAAAARAIPAPIATAARVWFIFDVYSFIGSGKQTTYITVTT